MHQANNCFCISSLISIRKFQWCCILAISYLTSIRLHAQEIDQRDFVSRYSKATAKMAAYYDHSGAIVRYRRQFSTSQPEKYKDSSISKKFVYKASDPLYLVENTSNFTKRADADQVYIVNRAGAFTLEKPAQSTAYIVVGFDQTVTATIDSVHANVRVAHAAYCHINIPLIRLFTSPVVKVKKCIRRDNRYLIDYSYVKGGHPIECHLVLDAERSMAQLEHTRQEPQVALKVTIAYEGDYRGIPLVKQVEHVGRDKSGSATEIWEVDQHLPGSFADNDFTLAAYGINDPFASSGLPPWAYLATALVLCVSGAVLFRAYRRRRQRTGTVA